MLWSFARCGYNDEALLQVMHDIAERMASSCERCGRASLWCAISGGRRVKAVLVCGHCM